MGRNRYRVLEVSGIGSILKYRYRRKIRYRYRVLFDTISILFRYFASTDILTLSCNEIIKKPTIIEIEYHYTV